MCVGLSEEHFVSIWSTEVFTLVHTTLNLNQTVLHKPRCVMICLLVWLVPVCQVDYSHTWLVYASSVPYTIAPLLMSPLNPSVSHWITQYVVIIVFKRNYIRSLWQVVAYTFYQVSILIVLNNVTTVQVYNQLNEVVNRNMFNIARLMSCHNIRKTLFIAVFHFRFVLPTRKYVHYVLTYP